MKVIFFCGLVVFLKPASKSFFSKSTLPHKIWNQHALLNLRVKNSTIQTGLWSPNFLLPCAFLLECFAYFGIPLFGGRKSPWDPLLIKWHTLNITGCFYQWYMSSFQEIDAKSREWRCIWYSQLNWSISWETCK